MIDELLFQAKMEMVRAAKVALERDLRVMVRVDGYESAFIPYSIEHVNGFVTMSVSHSPRTLYTTLDHILGIMVSDEP